MGALLAGDFIPADTIRADVAESGLVFEKG